MSDFFIVSAPVPTYADGKPVAEVTTLLGRIQEMTDEQILSMRLDSVDPSGWDDEEAYVTHVRELLGSAIQDVVIDGAPDVIEDSFGGGTPVYLTGGPSGGDDPTSSFAAVALLSESGLFDKPFSRT